MRPFHFSLQPVLNVKRIEEKQKKAELSKITGRLAEMYHETDLLKQRLEDSDSRRREELFKGTVSSRMAWYDGFAEYIHEQRTALFAAIEEERKKMEKKQAELIFVMNEIKTLEKLRKQQFSEYSAEVSKAEENILGDLMAYDNAVKKTG